jgi:hypothetical protein
MVTFGQMALENKTLLVQAATNANAAKVCSNYMFFLGR